MTLAYSHTTHYCDQDLHNHVVTQTAQAFVTSFLTRCVRVNLEHQHQADGDGSERESVPLLDLDLVIPRYRHSRKRLILVDFEGTLWLRDPRAKTFNPPKEALETLKTLAEEERNEVWLLSGLPIGGALDRVARDVPGIGIV